MRFIDVTTVLLLAAFLVLPLLTVRRWRLWSGVLLAPAVIVEVIRIAREHARWQMYPALTVLALSLLATALMHRSSARRWASAHRKSRIAGTLLLLIMLAGTPVAYIEFPMFELPRPSGAQNVGTTQLHLIDSSRLEVHTAAPLDHRELMVKVWYPADTDRCQRFAAYMEQAGAIARAVNEQKWPFGTVLSHLDQIPTHACVDAPVSVQQRAYPVLIFSHGLELGISVQNTVLMEELASRGYVIFSIDHTYQGLAAVFPDGEVRTFRKEAWAFHDAPRSADYERETARVKNNIDPGVQFKFAQLSLAEMPVQAQVRRFWYEWWSRDQRFVIDQLARMQSGDQPTPLAGRLDLDRIGVFGMSFGGASAAWTCARDARCKAGINLDGFGAPLIELEPHQQPFMSMNSEGQSANALFLDRDLNYRYWLQVKGTTHLNYSDMALMAPSAGGSIGARRMLSLTNAYVSAFFDCHLLNRGCELLDGPSSKYPEVTFIAKPPVADRSSRSTSDTLTGRGAVIDRPNAP
jgi:predicted dienelactone hydrolase